MKTIRPRKKRPDEIDRGALRDLDMTAEDWQEFEHGVRLFNEGKLWNSHEAWEQVWLRHNEDERLFFQGLIQLAAAYHQLVTKQSFRGMINNLDKAHAKLIVFKPEYLGILVTPLLKFIEQAKKEAGRLGDEGLDEFNYNLIPKLQFHKPSNPDLLVEIVAIVRSAQFAEGVKLFNTGYYWEAHEALEDVWREQEGGDAKVFVQAFVQMASGYSFIKLCKLSSAIYLFEKAIEKFREYEMINSGVKIVPLIEGLQKSLEAIRLHSLNGSKPFKAPGVPPIVVIEE